MYFYLCISKLDSALFKVSGESFKVIRWLKAVHKCSYYFVYNFQCNPIGGTKLVFYFWTGDDVTWSSGCIPYWPYWSPYWYACFLWFFRNISFFFQFFPKFSCKFQFFFNLVKIWKTIPGNMGVKYVQQLFQKRDEEHLEMKDDLNLMLNDWSYMAVFVQLWKHLSVLVLV